MIRREVYDIHVMVEQIIVQLYAAVICMKARNFRLIDLIGGSHWRGTQGYFDKLNKVLG